MTKYYKGQTLQMDVITEVDITGALTTEIYYRKPSGATGAWTATVVNAESGQLRYILPAADNNEVGIWTIWAHIVQADSTVVIGTPLEIDMHQEGY